MNDASNSISLDTERQDKAREYARIRRRLMLLELLAGGGYLILWIVTGVYSEVSHWVGEFTSYPGLAVLLYILALGIPYGVIIEMPLSYYSGFILPHRYDQSTQSFQDWAIDQIKGLIVGGILGFIVIEIVYLLLRISPGWWWLYAGGVMLLFTLILSILSPLIIMPLFYNFTPLENDDLTNRLIALSEKANTYVKGVFRFDMSSKTKSANAALMGLGATRRIVLGDTLINEFSHDEIETVLAHELGHHVNNDIPLLIGTSTIQTLLGFLLAHLALLWGVSNLGLSSIADPAGLPLLGLVTGILGFTLMPIGNAFSRWRERLADQYALGATQNPQAFINAMTRLANQNLADADPEPWIVWLLYSHPPISHRIAMARSYSGTST